MNKLDKVITGLNCCKDNYPKDCKHCPYEKDCTHHETCDLLIRNSLSVINTLIPLAHKVDFEALFGE